MAFIQVVKQIVVVLFLFLLGGCGTAVNSPSGDPGPALVKSIPKQERIATVSFLGDEASFFKPVGVISYETEWHRLPGPTMDFYLADVLKEELIKQGYQNVVTLNPSNPNELTKARIEIIPSYTISMIQRIFLFSAPGRGILTKRAKNYLRDLTQNKKIDLIMAIAPVPTEDKIYGVDCQHGPAGVLKFKFKLYAIDAHTFNVLAWQQAGTEVILPPSNVCGDYAKIPTATLAELSHKIRMTMRVYVQESASRMLTHISEPPDWHWGRDSL